LQGAWWITPNEKRDIMSFGMDESNPMMNEYLLPSGLMPMSGFTDEAVTDVVLEEAAKSLGIEYIKK
jgi:hypothetical protein